MKKQPQSKTAEASTDGLNRVSLPKGWSWAKVQEVGEVKLGRQRSPEHHHGQHMRPYLRVANVYEDRIDLSSVLEMNFTPKEYETYALQHGDILLNEGQSLELVGRPAMYRDELPGACFQNTLVRFRSGSALVPAFALFAFRHYLHSQVFQRIAQWTVNIAHLGATRFAELDLPVPPLNEQRRIVAKIEELFSDLDAGVATLERVRANLKRYRASVLKAAVEGKLTEDWRAQHPDTEPASVLLERILTERRRQWEKDQLAKFAQAGKQPPKGWQEKYQNPMSPESVCDVRLPAKWSFASVEQVSHFAKYGSSAKTSGAVGGVPVLRMGNIQDGRLDLSDLKYLPVGHDEFPDLLLQEGDLLFNRTNSAELVGKSAVYVGDPSPCSFASYLISVRPVAGCEPKILCYYLNSVYGRRWIASVVSQQVGQANVNGTKLQALAFPLAPLEEQAEIVQEVERRLSILDEIEAQVAANLKRAARLRQGILKRAFEGRLVPQDPTDEPAEKLLARIREQRNATPRALNGTPGTRQGGRRRSGGSTLPMFPEGGSDRE